MLDELAPIRKRKKKQWYWRRSNVIKALHDIHTAESLAGTLKCTEPTIYGFKTDSRPFDWLIVLILQSIEKWEAFSGHV